MRLGKQLAYARKVMLSATWHALQSPVHRPVHLILALADHFEPSIVPEDGQKRAPRSEQERRLGWWTREYPKVVDGWRDHDGRPLVHTYFYPAEQYDEGLIDMLAESLPCRVGRSRDPSAPRNSSIPTPPKILANCWWNSATNWPSAIAVSPSRRAPRLPRYAFVHGNFALANSAGGLQCGVDSEMQILAETGCYADMTLPTASGIRRKRKRLIPSTNVPFPSIRQRRTARGATWSWDARPGFFLSSCKVRS